MARPPFVKNFKEIQKLDPTNYPNCTEPPGIISAFTREFGFKRIGVSHETLKPGMRTSWPHAHSHDEEFVYVLKGNPDAWIDGELYRLEPGDGVGFPGGTGISHTFLNNTDSDVELIVVGDFKHPEDTGVYPLSKIGNEWLEKRGKLWKTPPQRKLGPHDGLPDLMRNK